MSTSLGLEALTQAAAATIRVTFTQNPLAASSGGANDALNPINWSVSGPAANAVLKVSGVSGDPRSIDLTMATQLALGTWTVNIANIQTPAGDPFDDPATMTLDVTVFTTQEDVNKGAKNHDAEERLRRNLNPAFKGPGWDALIAALATGDTYVEETALLAAKQLNVSTSSGKYLQARGGDRGIRQPDGIGINDDLFRRYVIKRTASQLTLEVLYEILEVFYGPDAVRAHAVSGGAPPYVLDADYDLQILIDETTEVNVVFDSDDAADLSAATALEVAAAITRTCQQADTKAWATAVTDPETGETRVVVYSESLGLNSSVRITGGRAQNVLLFDTQLDIISDISGLTWTAVYDSSTGRTRFTPSTDNVDLSLLRIDDYVNIYGSNFATDNKGSFPIVDVYYGWELGNLVQWFEVELDGFDQGANQDDLADVMFFRPTRSSIYNGSRTVVVTQVGDLVHIVLPATTAAVARTALTAAYPQCDTIIDATTAERDGDTGIVTVTTDEAHGLAADDQIIVDGLVASADQPARNPGTGDNTGYAPIPLLEVVDSPFSSINGGAALLNTDEVLVFGGASFTGISIQCSAGSTLTHGQRFWLSDGTIDAKIELYLSPLDPIGVGYSLLTFTVLDTANTVATNLATLLNAFGFTAIAVGSVVTVTTPTSNPRWAIPFYNITAVGFAINTTSAVATTGLFSSSGSIGHAPLGLEYVYDFTAASSMAAASRNFGFSFYDDDSSQGIVWVTGGTNAASTAAITTVRYFTGSAWHTGTALSTARAGHAQITDGTAIIVSGGVNSALTAVLNDVESFAADFGRAPFTPASLTYARCDHTMDIMDDYNYVVVGGRNLATTQSTPKFIWTSLSTIGKVLNTVEIQNGGGWDVAPMTYARFGHKTAKLTNGRLLIVGGRGYNPTHTSTDAVRLDSCEIFDPVTKKCYPGPKMNAARYGHALYRVGGRIMVVGGSPTALYAEYLDEDKMVWHKSSAVLENAIENIVPTVMSGNTTLLFGGNANSADLNLSGIEDSTFWIPGSETWRGRDLNGLHKVISVPSSTTFTYQTSDWSYALTGEGVITPMRSSANTVRQGPYIFDPNAGLGVGSVVGTLQTKLSKGMQYATITLDTDEATSFPDESGWLVLGFGTKYQVAPVRYLARLSSNELTLDYSFKFPSTVPAGSTVTLLKSKGAWMPDAPNELGAFYITGSAAGRVAASAACDEVIAAGMDVTKDIEYPGDRGLAGEGFPESGSYKLTDATSVWGSDDLDNEIIILKETT